MPEPLLPRIAAGDAAAVEECLARYSGLVWSLTRKFCRNREEAEDAAQEVFIEIWNKAARYDPSLSAEITFVAMIARRRLIDRGRRQQHAIAADRLEDEASLPQEDAAQELVDVGDEARRAGRALERLRPEERRLLELSIYEGLSHEQIARSVSLPLGTVKTHLRRGMARVREMLGVDDATRDEGGGA